MQVSVTFRHLEPSDSLKNFAREKVERVQKFLDQASEAQVVLSIEKHMHHAEILVHSGPFFLRGKDKSDDMYASIGLAIEKVERQIKRYKQRLRQHKPAGHHNADALRVKQSIIEAHAEPAAEEVPVQPPSSKVLETRELLAKRLTLDEAVTQLRLVENDFLIFTNAATNHVAVLYRRTEDGTFGLIDAVPSK
jgi:putative sigma-54 modulation protein